MTPTIPSNEELKNKLSSAPMNIQDYIGSEELLEVFLGIKKTHKLHLDEAGNLSRALNAVFLGVRPAEEFPELLKLALEQNSSAYDGVLKDVNEKIFVAFRRKMQEPAATPVAINKATPSNQTTQGTALQTEVVSPAGSIKRIGEHVMKQAERVEVNTLAASASPSSTEVSPSPASTSEPKKYPTIDPYREEI